MHGFGLRVCLSGARYEGVLEHFHVDNQMAMDDLQFHAILAYGFLKKTIEPRLVVRSQKWHNLLKKT